MFKDERKPIGRRSLNLLLASTTWESMDAPLDSRQVSGVSHKASTGNKSKLLSRLGHSSLTRGGRAKLLNADSRKDQSQNMSESYHDCQKEQQGHNGRTMDSNLVQICPEILFIYIMLYSYGGHNVMRLMVDYHYNSDCIKRHYRLLYA